MSAITGGAVLLRVGSKLLLGQEFWLDDYAVILAYIIGTSSTIIENVGLAANGFGRDIWTLTPAEITSTLLYFHIEVLLYFSHVALFKLVLLFFYLRIFLEKKLRNIIWGTIWVDVVFGLTFVVAANFQCRPISYNWQLWDGEHVGTCVNINALAWANAAGM